MDQRTLGTFIVVMGLVLIVIGLVTMTGALSWFGRLPGDLRWERGGTRVYLPLASMFVASVALTLLLALARRLF